MSPAIQPNYVLLFVEIERESRITISLDISLQYFPTAFGVDGEQGEGDVFAIEKSIL